jgi:hypothetical protein
MNDEISASIATEVRRELVEDFVGLWVVTRRARELCENDKPIISVVMESVERLLADHSVSVGDFDRGIFSEWEGSHEDFVRRIRAELESLGRDPNIGEVCWFTLKKEESEKNK